MKYWMLCVALCLLVACESLDERVAKPVSNPPIPPTITPTKQVTAVPTATDIDQLFNDIFASWLEADPEWATQLGLADQFNIDESQLTQISETALQAANKRDREDLALLQGLDRTGLAPEQQLSLDILIWELSDRVQGQEFIYYPYTLHQLFSVPNRLPEFMGDVHPLDNVADVENFIGRLQLFNTKFEQLIAGNNTRAEHGLLPPAYILERTEASLNYFASQSPTESVIYTGFARRIAEVDWLSAEEKAGWLTAVRQEIAHIVQPAYRQLAQFTAELRQQAGNEDGVWHLPNGRAYYAYALQQHTTTNLTAEEIHELGLQEVARIQAEIEAALTKMGLNNISQVYQITGGFNISSDMDRELAIEAYESAIVLAQQKMTGAFTLWPQTPLDIQRVPPYNEGVGPGAYYSSPPLDGSRPGIFFVNLRNGSFISQANIPTLAYHEGIPGHHFQRALQREMTHLPTFRRAAHVTAFAEGWGLYAERLVWELGVYEENEAGNIGRLQAELFRAVRLVVDTGIHHFAWTREEAIVYMMSVLGWSRAAAQAEVERYIVWPGQATAYKIGQLTILRLRDKSHSVLGEQFSIAEFHKIILQNGDIPLTILEQVVENWLESKRQ